MHDIYSNKSASQKAITCIFKLATFSSKYCSSNAQVSCKNTCMYCNTCRHCYWHWSIFLSTVVPENKAEACLTLTLPAEIDLKPSRRRRRVKSFEAGRPAALSNDGDLFEKTIEAAKRAQNRALWKEGEVDADVFSLLHLWESIEIGDEKDDNTSSPNRSQISNSNMPERKQLFPRSA